MTIAIIIYVTGFVLKFVPEAIIVYKKTRGKTLIFPNRKQDIYNDEAFVPALTWPILLLVEYFIIKPYRSYKSAQAEIQYRQARTAERESRKEAFAAEEQYIKDLLQNKDAPCI